MKFSRRTDNPAGSVSPLVRDIEELRQGGGVRFDLTRTDPTGWPERRQIEHKALEFLWHPSSIHYCPDPQGWLPVRELLSVAQGGEVPPEDWFLCASTSEAYSILFQLLCDPGDAVVVNRPSYPLLDDLARHGGLRLVDVPLRFIDGLWQLDIGQLERAFSASKVKAFCLIQPGNPTGWFLSDLERLKVVALCAKFQVALISDEVFADYCYQPGFRSLAGETGCLSLTLSGLSKGFGLPGLKLGWIGLSGSPEVVPEARERLQRLNDSLLSASTPIQNAMSELWPLKSDFLEPLLIRLRENREIWSAFCCESTMALPVPAGWMAILKLETGTEELICSRLMDRGVLVQPGFLFDLPWDGVVLSLLVEPEVFRAGLSVLQDIVVSLLRS